MDGRAIDDVDSAMATQKLAVLKLMQPRWFFCLDLVNINDWLNKFYGT